MPSKYAGIESTKEVPRGRYKIKLAKGAVWTPVLVFIPREPPFVPDPEYDGPSDRKRYPVALLDDQCLADPRRLGPYLIQIDRKEYEALVASHKWAREHAPASAEANTYQVVDLTGEIPLF